MQVNRVIWFHIGEEENLKVEEIDNCRIDDRVYPPMQLHVESNLFDWREYYFKILQKLKREGTILCNTDLFGHADLDVYHTITPRGVSTEMVLEENSGIISSSSYNKRELIKYIGAIGLPLSREIEDTFYRILANKK